MISYNVMKNCIRLSHDEFEIIKDLDQDIINEYINKIVLYYGVNDNFEMMQINEKYHIL